MSIRKALMFVPRRLLTSQLGLAVAPAVPSATEAAVTVSRGQRDVGWGPVSAAAAASGTASPPGVAAVLVPPKPKPKLLAAHMPPVGWKPAPKPLPIGIVASSALRKAPRRGMSVVVTSQTMHRATLHLTADCSIAAAPATPPPATAHGGVRKHPSRRRVMGMVSRSLLLVGALLIAGLPPVLV